VQQGTGLGALRLVERQQGSEVRTAALTVAVGVIAVDTDVCRQRAALVTAEPTGIAWAWAQKSRR